MIKDTLDQKNSGEDYIMNLALGYQVSQVLFAAMDMNIFGILENGAMSASALAKALGGQQHSLSRLLHTLVSLNLLRKNNGRFSNTERASQYLVKGKNCYLGNAIQHSSNLWDFWEGLDEQIKKGNGKGPDEIHLKNYHHRLKDYLEAMNDFAVLKASKIADAISIQKYKKMLDVGCGPGTYAMDFAKQNPKLHCTLVDLAPNLAYAQETIKKSKCWKRIRTAVCQLLEDNLPGNGYDLIFISNLLHMYGKKEVQIIIEKAWDKAKNHANMVIHDYIMEETKCGSIYASLFDLNMLVGTPRGKCYTFIEIRKLLDDLGAKHIKQVPVSLGSSLIMGMKQI